MDNLNKKIVFHHEEFNYDCINNIEFTEKYFIHVKSPF